ncbi:MAG TPA: hypothetical protein VFN25_00360 [Dokdonella sp.]|uniref:hypothetical protein n=1 Tax=Dokdonella sp. TaxID=2291710 RepID=UPI002D8110EF|nr:hypothetical protein [Dokdonella sp.]HET9031334.1 hypothetical protein [Dokdonella sp.]
MKSSFARGLIWISLLGFCLAAAPGLASTNILLDANFNDKTLNAAVGTGGPNVREPIFVHPQLQARVVAGPLATPSLHIKHLTGANLEAVVFELPGQQSIRDGDLRIAYTVRSPSTLGDFRSWVSEPANSVRKFGILNFTGTGNIHATDDAGFTGYLATYVPNQTLKVEYIYHTDAGTYDLRIDNVLLLANRPHGVTTPGVGIGRLALATNQTSSWVVDDVFSAHTRKLLLKADFNDKQLNAPLGTGGAIFGEPTAITPGLSVIVRAAPLATPSLHFSQTTITTEKTARFELLGGAEARNGELKVGFTVHTPPVLDTFRMRTLKRTTTSFLFGGVEFTSAGKIRTLHELNGNTDFFDYAPDTTYRIDLVYQLAAGTYDIYIDDKIRLPGVKHIVPIPEQGIAALEFGLTGNTAENWVVDDVRVEHNPLLLDADFNQQLVDYQLDTGGAGAGQPISIHSSLIAEPIDGHFPTRALALQQSSTGTAKTATFEFLRNVEVSSGELRIGVRVRPPPGNDSFSIDIHEQGSSTADFGSLTFMSNGDIRTCDAAGSVVFSSYVPGNEQQFEFRYHLDSGKYDIYVDRVPKVIGRGIAAGRGIGRITAGTTISTSGRWVIEDLHAYQLDDTIFENGFD